MTGPAVRGETSEERRFLLQAVVYPLVALGCEPGEVTLLSGPPATCVAWPAGKC